MLALERVQPTQFLASAVGITGAERRKEPRARELVSMMGLDRYRDKQIQELSTGTRRITEITCLVALEPVCLLLDEPSSGIAQRETEALGGLLADLKDQLDLTLFPLDYASGKVPVFSATLMPGLIRSQDRARVLPTFANILTLVEFTDGPHDRRSRRDDRAGGRGSSAWGTGGNGSRVRINGRSSRLIGGILTAVIGAGIGAFRKLRAS